MEEELESPREQARNIRKMLAQVVSDSAEDIRTALMKATSSGDIKTIESLLSKIVPKAEDMVDDTDYEVIPSSRLDEMILVYQKRKEGLLKTL